MMSAPISIFWNILIVTIVVIFVIVLALNDEL